MDRDKVYVPGEQAWFEYHCYEGHDSADAQVWYRSHQRVEVLTVDDPEGFLVTMPTYVERQAEGCPITYRVRFTDGLEWSVFEDELSDDTSEWCRPDPPKEGRRGHDHAR